MRQFINKSLLSIFLMFFTNFCYSQKQGNIWYFGNNAGIDFNNGSPVALLSGQTNALEGTSVISDSIGSLLFYSDGMTVWNKNHQVMQNGTNLLGNTSTTQSSIIVPDPANPNRHFYLFTVSSGFSGGNISDGLRYSKIDICLDSSRGGIVPTEKNIKIVDTVAEKIAVTRHSNGIDYWILTHKFYSNEFWALLLSSSGIVDTVISKIGSFHTGNIAGSQGQLKFSNNGQKIAIAASNGLNLLEVFDFDNTFGIISNYLSIEKPNNNNASIYGVEFSPDNSKLYATGATALGSGYCFLVQYDLIDTTSGIIAINSSMNLIYNDGIGLQQPIGLQVGPNQKIYMVSLNSQYALSAINNPNNYGSACNFQDQSVSLSGNQGAYTLPSFIAGFEYSNSLIECDQTSVLENDAIKCFLAYPNPFRHFFTVELPKEQNFSLLMYDVTGRIMYENKNARGTLKVDCSNLGSGVYFVKAVNQRTVLTGKMVKE